MATFEITSPDGQKYKVNAPEGASEQDAIAYVQNNFYANPKKDKQGSLANSGLGFIKAASDIGTTLLAPVDWAYDKFTGNDKQTLSSLVTGKNPQSTHEWRKQQLAEFFGDKADTESIAFKGGELFGDVIGTAGAGGLAAKGLRAIPAIAKAAPSLINSIESGGFILGKPAATTGIGKAADVATRAVGGGVAGGLSAGAINPETAAEGAMIGSVIPGAATVAGKTGRAIKNAVSGTARSVVGSMSGVGSEVLSEAYKAGKTGNQSFVKNMRGNSDMTDVLDSAKDALSQIRAERGAAYRQGMADVSSDKTVLDLGDVIKSASDALDDTMYKGVIKKKNAANMASEIKATVDEWAGLNPSEYHTPEGLDALKQRIGDLRDGTQFGSPERRVADSVYGSIKKQISSQAPTYSKTMKEYEQASELISEIQKSLSLGEKASADTAIRKLQSLMRNNVNTNYGNRLSLASELESRGANILPQVAGQAVNSFVPRGLAQLGGIGLGIGSFANPAAIAAMPFTSPRLMGETAYALGRAAGGVGNVSNGVQNLIGQMAAKRGLNKPVNYGLLSTIPAVYTTNH